MRIIITEDQEELLKNKINDLVGKKVLMNQFIGQMKLK
jgi:hypothetical protein